MTICVGALAAEGNSIICVADRSVSYGDDITGDSDATKIIKLPSGVVAMVSGGEAEYERVLRKLGRNPQLGSSLPDTINYCETCYQEARSELIDIRHLKPNLIQDSTALLNASLSPTVNRHVRSLMETVSSFDMGCHILLCGFDETTTAFLLQLENPGQVNDLSRTGYAAIGSGWPYAIARLVWNDWTRAKPIDQALFYAVDAKITAEINPFISGEWDASVIVPPNICHEVPKRERDIIDKAWVKYSHSPYWKREPDDWDPPPKNWKQLLHEYAESITPSTST